MSGAAVSVTVILTGAVLLFMGAGNADRTRTAPWLVRVQRWFTIGGALLLTTGVGIQIVRLSPEVGACPATSGLPAGAHCFHGAPWPPHGSSR